ncbi:MAG: hypothetical protein KBD06_05285 [Candidatus Pacebacteria bacterium]|nr:hypothetical protein [Candidatus Paceibacterota bacterium]
MQDHTVVLRWNAYEHEHIERGTEWFWALGIAAVCAALTAVLLSDILFSVLILLAAFTIALLARHAPDVSTFELSIKGVRVDKTLHRYDEIISFWVEDEHDGHPLLLIDTLKFMSPNLIIPIHDIDPQLVRAYLKEHVHEVRMKEPVAHKVLEFFGI